MFAGVLLTLVAAGCGGSGNKGNAGNGSPGPAVDPVATVGSTAVTGASLAYWMPPLFTGTFYELTQKQAPAGVVSLQPHYDVCVAGLRSVVVNKQRWTSARLMKTCEDLHKALTAQAVSYVVGSAVLEAQAAEQGVVVKRAEAEREFKRIQSQQFPSEAELQRYLSQRRWTVPQELFLVKRDVLSTRLKKVLEKKFRRRGGYSAIVKYASRSNRLWTGRTSCMPGYIASGCRQFGPAQEAVAAKSRSASSLIEELVAK